MSLFFKPNRTSQTNMRLNLLTSRLNRLEKKYRRQKEAILERNKEKRVERQAKNDEIRAKYGKLTTD